MSKFIAFDIGKVLCHFDMDKFVKEFSEIVDISQNTALAWISRIQHLQDIGVTTLQQTLEANRNQFQTSFLDDETIYHIVAAWNKEVYPNEIMMNFLNKLRKNDVKIAFLSNMGQEHLKHLRSNFPYMFENVIQHISCEVGARKPTKLFYQSFLFDNPEFHKAIYLDDISENLDVGLKYKFFSMEFNLDTFTLLGKTDQDQIFDSIINRL